MVSWRIFTELGSPAPALQVAIKDKDKQLHWVNYHSAQVLLGERKRCIMRFPIRVFWSSRLVVQLGKAARQVTWKTPVDLLTVMTDVELLLGLPFWGSCETVFGLRLGADVKSPGKGWWLPSYPSFYVLELSKGTQFFGWLLHLCSLVIKWGSSYSLPLVEMTDLSLILAALKKVYPSIFFMCELCSISADNP